MCLGLVVYCFMIIFLGTFAKNDSCQLIPLGQKIVMNSVRMIAKRRIEKQQNKGKITLMPGLESGISAINPNLKVK